MIRLNRSGGEQEAAENGGDRPSFKASTVASRLEEEIGRDRGDD